MHAQLSLVRMLEDLAVWTGLAAALLILVAWRLAPDGEAHKRLKVATFFLVAGAAVAALGTWAHIGNVRLVGVVAVGVALVRAVLVLLFDTLPLLKQTPKIVRDIIAGFIYFLALMVVLGGAGVKIESLLTTSALLTAVLGFALQETLGNLFAGLALQAQRPFSVGDWIQLEGSTVPAGRVLEVNWRVTKVLTLDQVEVSFPNSVLAKTPITNFSLPKATARRSLYLHVGYDNAPDRVCEVLDAAVAGTEGVLADPPPNAIARAFDESGVSYWVRFFIDDWAKRDVIDHRVWTRIWYALEREEMPIPYPTRTLHMHEMTDEHAARAQERSVLVRLEALRAVDFLAPLPEPDLRRLADGLRVRHFAPAETILQQGDPGESFFLIQEGEVAVHIATADGQSAEVARLRPGQFFGEMSLMTGDPRTATVRTVSRTELYEIDHTLFASVLLGHEEVAAQMSAILAERQLSKGDRASAPGEESSKQEALLSRIKKFFHLGA